jgi:hypothetical protein
VKPSCLHVTVAGITAMAILAVGSLTSCLTLYPYYQEDAGQNGDAKYPAPDAGQGYDSVPVDFGAPIQDGAPVEVDANIPACPRPLAAADRPRKLVISHPYTEARASSGTIEVFDLSTNGDLLAADTPFQLDQVNQGRIVFTPDGEIGMVAHEDGSIGVFRFTAGVAPTVIHQKFTGSFYATTLTISDDGQKVYVVDSNWRNNGGGIYELAIGCDGTLMELGLVAPSKLAQAMVWLHQTPNRAVVAAYDLLDSPIDQSTHLLDLAGDPTLLSSVNGFGDNESILSDLAVTYDDQFVLVGDNSGFSNVANRVAVGKVQGNNLITQPLITPIKDPTSILASPFNNAALVISGFSDAAFRLSYDPLASPAFVNEGELSYKGASPQLPSVAVMVDRGTLKGRVWVAENVGIRQLRFNADGTISDLGLFPLGKGYDKIVGAIGVQP